MNMNVDCAVTVGSGTMRTKIANNSMGKFGMALPTGYEEASQKYPSILKKCSHLPDALIPRAYTTSPGDGLANPAVE